jgi:hypothetical protein
MPEVQKVYSETELENEFRNKTFKNLQKEPTITLTEDSTFRFSLPNTRYTSRVYLLVRGTFDLTHASATDWNAVRHREAPWNLIKKIKLDLNNGFAPFTVSAYGNYLINLCNPQNDHLRFDTTDSATNRAAVVLTDVAASGGDSNTFQMLIELPLQINKRDFKGLINTQDPNLQVTVEIETGNAEDMFTSTTGYTVGTPSWTCTPFIESFTVPANTLTDPTTPLIDLTTIKTVMEQTWTISASGEFIVKLPIGQWYRRVILDFHSSGTALTAAQITNFIMALNQADQPLNLSSYQLAALNHQQIGETAEFPEGSYLFDFTDQGFLNYGGSRDYINTNGLNEFWIKCQLGTTGTVRAYYETLTKLPSA